MKTIVIGFSKPKDFKLYAYLIMKIDGGLFDHAYLKFHSDSLNRDIVYQAVGKGVQFVGKILFETKNISVEEYEIQVSDDKYTEMMQFCIDNAGMPYGFVQVLSLGIKKLLSKLNIKINNNPNQVISSEIGLKTEFCSEIVTRCLNKVDPKDFDLNAESITPKDLNSILKSLNIKQIL